MSPAGPETLVLVSLVSGDRTRPRCTAAWLGFNIRGPEPGAGSGFQHLGQHPPPIFSGPRTFAPFRFLRGCPAPRGPTIMAPGAPINPAGRGLIEDGPRGADSGVENTGFSGRSCGDGRLLERGQRKQDRAEGTTEQRHQTGECVPAQGAPRERRSHPRSDTSWPPDQTPWGPLSPTALGRVGLGESARGLTHSSPSPCGDQRRPRRQAPGVPRSR